jgi:aryl-alcohol dehydrogenase-like predicted oxidoreductase
MQYRKLGNSGFEVSAYGLGVMTFGGQTPENDAMRQMDMAFAAGITLFDTAENYPTPTGPATQGRSEKLLGEWISSRKVRDKVVIATKVAGPGNAAGDMTHIRGADRRLDRANISAAVDASLSRLNVDVIDLYQVHWPERAVSTHGRQRFSNLPDREGQTSIEETLAALAEQVSLGKIRAIGASNYSAERLALALDTANRLGLPRFQTLQPEYNLMVRQPFEASLQALCVREQVSVIPYYALASGFLTGKYRQAADASGRARGGRVATYLNERGFRILAALDTVAAQHRTSLTAVTLAWLRDRASVAAPIASATSAAQLNDLFASLQVELNEQSRQLLDEASA